MNVDQKSCGKEVSEVCISLEILNHEDCKVGHSPGRPEGWSLILGSGVSKITSKIRVASHSIYSVLVHIQVLNYIGCNQPASAIF